MIWVCGSCGKRYLFRGDPGKAPACRSCGGAISPEAPIAGAEVDRMATLERQNAAAKASLEMKERELQGARVQIENFRSQILEAEAIIEARNAQFAQDLAEARRQSARLEHDIDELHTRRLSELREKEAELEEASASIARYGEEIKKIQDLYKEAVLKRDEESSEHARDKEEAQAAIARLGDDLKKAQDAYKEALRRKDEEIEHLRQRTVSLEAGQVRVSQSGTAASMVEIPREAGGAREDEKSRQFKRAQERIRQLEKVVLEAERQYRSLQQHLSATTPTESIAEKDKTISDLRSAVALHQGKAGELQRRIDNLERILQGKVAHGDAHARARGDVEARLAEAQSLASDFRRDLEAISATLQGLVDRMNRFHQSLSRAAVDSPTGVVPGDPPDAPNGPPDPGHAPDSAFAGIQPVSPGDGPLLSPEAPPEPPSADPESKKKGLFDKLFGRKE